MINAFCAEHDQAHISLNVAHFLRQMIGMAECLPRAPKRDVLVLEPVLNRRVLSPTQTRSVAQMACLSVRWRPKRLIRERPLDMLGRVFKDHHYGGYSIIMTAVKGCPALCVSAHRPSTILPFILLPSFRLSRPAFSLAVRSLVLIYRRKEQFTAS